MARAVVKGKKRPAKPQPAALAESKNSPRLAEAAQQFVPLTRVTHRTFGTGVVVSVDGDKLEIKFKSVGTKTIINSYVTID